jgi:hypothetical protein
MPERYQVRTKAWHRVAACLPVILTGWLFGGTGFAQETQKEPLVATVTDVKGETTNVNDPRGRYTSPGETRPAAIPGYVYQLSGSTEHLPRLVIGLALKEGRTTWEEEITIPFSELRQISFESRPTAPFPPEIVLLERRDGSRVLIERTDNNVSDYDTFEERDSRGEVKRAIKPGLGRITVSARFKERRFLLEGFEGQARTSTGVKGEFYIELREVRTITFK